jgi:hypothetical protein
MRRYTEAILHGRNITLASIDSVASLCPKNEHTVFKIDPALEV